MSRQNVWGIGGGLLLIGLGVLFLIGQLLPGNAMQYLWPFFLIGVSVLFFIGMVSGGKSTGALAIPGSVIGMLGLVFLAQAVFDIWATWAYAWTLLIVAAGIGLAIFSRWSNIPQLHFVSRIVITVGGLLFLFFGIFFEAIFALSGARSLGGVLWSLLLIGGGIMLLFGRESIRKWFSFDHGLRDMGGTWRSVDAEPPSVSQPDVQNVAAWDTSVAPGTIQRLVFRSIGDMTIVQGENEGLEVQASEALKSRVRSRVQGGAMEVWYQSDWWDWLDIGLWGGGPLHYRLTVRSLEGIRMTGVGNVKAEVLHAPRFELIQSGTGNITIGSLDTDDLYVRMNGLGNVDIKGGRAARQTVDQRGLGSYSSGQMDSQATSVNLSGMGSATVRVSERLDALVSGMGSINYYGQPQVSKSVRGMGSINARC